MAELEHLRNAYRASSSPGTEHLSDEQWERLACGEMDPAARKNALKHILVCPECAQVYRGVLGVKIEAHRFDEGAPTPALSPQPKSGRVWKRWLAGLAAVAGVIAVLLILIARPTSRTGPSVGARQPVTLRSGESTLAPALLAPVGPVVEPPAELSWKPVRGARGYVVELLDGDGELLWKSEELTATRAPWPQGVEAPHGRYYWRVLAVPEAGGEPVASQLQELEVGISANRP